jgi:adenylate cyclase
MIMRRHQEALTAISHSSVRAYPIAALTAGCHAQLGDIDRARLSVADCLSIKPDFSIRQFMKREPFKAPGDAAQIANSLRLAGLPD